MRGVVAAALLLGLAIDAAATDVGAPDSASGPRKRLDLGMFGSPYATGPSDQTQALRFESWVEVIGDPKASPDETMQMWWKRFALPETSVYGRDYNLRPDAQPNAVNLLPVFEKIYDKLKKRK